MTMNKTTNSELDERLRRIETQLDAQAWRNFYSDLEEYKRQGFLVEIDRGETRYVRSTEDGWLTVLIQGTRKSLPSGLKVSLMKSENNRDYGVVSEGQLAGVSFDVSKGNLSASYDRFTELKLTVRKKTGAPVKIDKATYDRDLILAWKEGGGAKSLGPFHTMTDASNPIPTGMHKMEIPDFPHDLGQSYKPHGKVWFRIGETGDRYVHAGYESAGCLTNDPATWTQVYDVLHKSRTGDGKSVGILDFS
jgi:hypothetical protein